MIARHESAPDREDLWARIAAPVPKEAISWRQDGRPVTRDGKTMARFVCYIEANTVRTRLDAVVPGEWDLTLELLPALPTTDESDEATACAFKARLQVLGVIREDIGVGKDYKQASTDAFKRAAVRFGIGHELYDYDQNWVEVTGEGRYPKPVEDPAKAYARRYGPQSTAQLEDEYADSGSSAMRNTVKTSTAMPAPVADPDALIPLLPCPKCGGPLWDNRATKRNPRAPDGKCRNRACDGVQWPPKDGSGIRVETADDIPFP